MINLFLEKSIKEKQNGMIQPVYADSIAGFSNGNCILNAFACEGIRLSILYTLIMQ